MAGLQGLGCSGLTCCQQNERRESEATLGLGNGLHDLRLAVQAEGGAEGQCVRIEEILVGRRVRCALPCPSDIAIGTEVLMRVIQLEFDPCIIGPSVIEGREDQGLVGEEPDPGGISVVGTF